MRSDRRGTVLIVVTVILILVSLSAYGFVVSMQTESRADRLRSDQVQCDTVADSGVEFLLALLDLPVSQRIVMGGLDDNPVLFRGQTVSGDQQDRGLGRFFVVSPSRDPGVEDGLRFGTENESAKLHFSRLLDWDEQSPGAARLALMQLPGMTPSIADALLDWIDEDDLPRAFGAESEYYRGLEPPTEPSNMLPSSLAELLQVRGVTRELLLGVDHDQNFRIDRHESGNSLAPSSGRGATGASASTESLEPWSRFLTVHSAERNNDSTGNPRVFLNQPDLTLLHQELLMRFPESWASFIVSYRQFGPSESSESEGEDGTPLTIDFSKPPAFEISSPLELVGARINIDPESDEPEIVTSPFGEKLPAMQNDLPRLCDQTTTDPNEIIVGRIQLDLASPHVLRAHPMIDEALAARIVGARDAGDDVQRRRSQGTLWLLLEGIVDLPTMISLLPDLTTRGDVVRAQVIGLLDQQSPWSRLDIVIDGASTPSRVIHRRSLRNLGQGFRIGQLISSSDQDGVVSVNSRWAPTARQD